MHFTRIHGEASLCARPITGVLATGGLAARGKLCYREAVRAAGGLCCGFARHELACRARFQRVWERFGVRSGVG